jgi:hypothetical protein
MQKNVSLELPQRINQPSRRVPITILTTLPTIRHVECGCNIVKSNGSQRRLRLFQRPPVPKKVLCTTFECVMRLRATYWISQRDNGMPRRGCFTVGLLLPESLRYFFSANLYRPDVAYCCRRRRFLYAAAPAPCKPVDFLWLACTALSVVTRRAVRVRRTPFRWKCR